METSRSYPRGTRSGDWVTADTPVGYELQSLKKKAAVQLMGSRLWGRFNPNHWDPVYAAKTGLKAPIQTGEMSSAYLAEMCVNHFGEHFFTGARFSCKYVAATLANEVISTHGIITAKQENADEVRFTVDLWAQNEAGEKKTVGTLDVAVPRGKGAA
ncbi:fatty acid synthase subunit beta [Altererythrobacter sp. SALINAS58]|uniref:MaoC/PaaZ C-terminal domain-containing protein n=1 Tax=Alteripontixanthobacter muriae TaxID=2705546 RepID=UPI0015773AD0|nr:MaoC/PaaZ C-terminal domain-containing protein [Alteripontixanthobacter muriae]NTZ43822.1 fatty acid synthase subunit beta [Alteripontixanthobacter muriae]